MLQKFKRRTISASPLGKSYSWQKNKTICLTFIPPLGVHPMNIPVPSPFAILPLEKTDIGEYFGIVLHVPLTCWLSFKKLIKYDFVNHIQLGTSSFAEYCIYVFSYNMFVKVYVGYCFVFAIKTSWIRNAKFSAIMRSDSVDAHF